MLLTTRGTNQTQALCIQVEGVYCSSREPQNPLFEGMAGEFCWKSFPILSYLSAVKSLNKHTKIIKIPEEKNLNTFMTKLK